jgi:microfibrillar-associated protein 1
MAKKQDGGFGRDEMNALLGGGLSESVLRPHTVAPSKGKTIKPDEKDVADMTVEETAAWLLSQQRMKAGKVGQTQKGAMQQARHRTGKVRQYHQLLAEETQHREKSKELDTAGSDEDTDDLFANKQLRMKNMPISAQRTKAEPVVVGKRRRRYDSSSDEESDSKEHRQRLEPGSSSSSSDDDDSETDRRRQRLLAKRQLGLDRSIDHDVGLPSSATMENLPANEQAPRLALSSDAPIKAVSVEKNVSCVKPPAASSEEGSSSGSEDSSSEEESSDDDGPVIAKPIFVPKHRRGTLKSATELEAEDTHQELKQKALEEKRKQESRAMVQQVVAATAQAAPDFDVALDGITGAQNTMPDDADDSDNEVARDAWEIREVARLIDELDVEDARLQEERDLSRRRKMTDEERLAEDIATGRYQRPGQPKQTDLDQTSAKRYYHRGAYYMDESEWDSSDVRHKSAVYARAATGDDKINRAALPEVMRVKKFGFANQNLKYKGLAAEDTSDKNNQILPLVNIKDKSKR